jgi:hypothetical protein
MQAYSDPRRENETHALPDIEVFEVWDEQSCPWCCEPSDDPMNAHCDEHKGFYWQSCFPGCLPDGDPVGPFETKDEALADAHEGMED